MIAGFGGEMISQAYLEERGLASSATLRGDFAHQAVRWWRHVARTLGPTSSARAVCDVAVIPLLELLGHERAEMATASFGLHGRLRAAHSVVIVVPWALRPSSAWRDAVTAGIAAAATWALITNGRSLRIVDCTRPWSRAAIELEFERLMLGPRGVALLWTLVNAATMAGAAPSLRSRVNESEAHGSRVCASLSDGVLAALPRLASALTAGRTSLPRASALDQSLTLLYRVLFLLFAEARALVPVWNEIYREGYTIDALTGRAMQADAAGLWPALQAISRLAHAGCRAGDLTVTAFNGRLFSPRHAPLIDQRRIPDDVIREVLLLLATRSTPGGRRRISYHDLGVEQLGSVYERVLEYEPAANKRSTLSRTSTKRKSTGSFYTPRALTDFLVRRALGPLVEGRTAQQILDLRIVDPAMGSGAFLVSACHFLADSCEHAMLREGQWLEADATPSHRATLRRSVAERCLYGVDLNPTAVQLARLSLWLTTLAADRPLTFLDHHLACGNSLVGARLADLSKPLTPARWRQPTPLPLFDSLLEGEVASHVLPARLRLAMEPSDSLEAVKSKEHALAELGSPTGAIARLTAAADAWSAALLRPGSPPSAGELAEWIAAATGGATLLPKAKLQASLAQASQVAGAHGVFHWELAFPEVFLDPQGHPAADAGFDAVIGNPPWDMLRADTGSSAERSDTRASTSSVLRFCRASYRHQGRGHSNSYQLFTERALQLAKAGGRIGLILPSGIATDHGSAPLRRHLFDRTAIDGWLGFDNRSRIFPIHRSMRFVVLSATNAGSTDTLRFHTGLVDAGAIEREAAAPLTVTRSRLEAWSSHLTVPEIGNATALAIVTNVFDRVPALSDARGWHARFGRELNATDDRPHFVRVEKPSRSLLPVIEGKQLSPFQVDAARSTFAIPGRTAMSLLDPAQFDRGRIAYRDVAGATNKLTLIAAMLPRGTVSTHTLFCLKSPMPERDQWCLLALMNSLVANYLVRLQVTTHVTTALMSRLPVPKPDTTSREFDSLARLALTLAQTGIAEPSDDDYATLNSIAASLYGVSRDEYEFILDTFPLLPRPQRDLCLSVHIRATEAPKHGGL
jgi:hypothetical protein